MSAQRTRTAIKRAASILAPLGIMAAVVVTVAAECKIIKVDLPDQATLKLDDGEHVIAKTNTERGRFEARVTVKRDVVSEPKFYLSGTLMKVTPEAQVPRELSVCLKQAADRADAAPPRDWLATLVRSARDWIEPPAQAYTCKTVLLGCTKTIVGWFCCARSNCGAGSATACAAA